MFYWGYPFESRSGVLLSVDKLTISVDVQQPYVEGWVALRDKVRSAVKAGASQVFAVS